MRFLVIALALALLYGCCAIPVTETTDYTTDYSSDYTYGASNTTAGATNDTKPVAGGEGTIIEAPSGPGGSGTIIHDSTATSQTDCATLTPDCESCLSKEGCGWCKSSNSCLYGDASGPSVSSCGTDDWMTESCKVSGCSENTNCASCLSASGCKWCIQGALCEDESSSDSCFGGWLTESYQCNYASR